MNDFETDLLYFAYKQDMAALAKMPPFQIEFTRLEVLMLLSNLQLALRHPHNNGDSRPYVEKITRQFQAMLAPDPTSAIALVLERGWNPEYDVPWDAPSPEAVTERRSLENIIAAVQHSEPVEPSELRAGFLALASLAYLLRTQSKHQNCRFLIAQALSLSPDEYMDTVGHMDVQGLQEVIEAIGRHLRDTDEALPAPPTWFPEEQDSA